MEKLDKLELILKICNLKKGNRDQKWKNYAYKLGMETGWRYNTAQG